MKLVLKNIEKNSNKKFCGKFLELTGFKIKTEKLSLSAKEN